MRIFLFVLLAFVNLTNGFSQELSFIEVRTEPAYCTRFDYQNGHGVAYASVTGGTPPYDYYWEGLDFEDIWLEPIFPMLNPGAYKITVTDAAGAIIIDTVIVDSLIMKADFHVFSDVLSEIPDGYIGFAPDTLGFINLSENYANPNNPFADTTSFWNFNYPEGEWITSHDFVNPVYKGFLHGGEFEACLVTTNYNSCMDTICKTIGLFGSLTSVDDNKPSGIFTLAAKRSNNEIIVTHSENTVDLKINLYSISGQLVYTGKIPNTTTSIPFNFERGIYLYEFADKNGQIISSGKLNF